MSERLVIIYYLTIRKEIEHSQLKILHLNHQQMVFMVILLKVLKCNLSIYIISVKKIKINNLVEERP